LSREQHIGGDVPYSYVALQQPWSDSVVSYASRLWSFGPVTDPVPSNRSPAFARPAVSADTSFPSACKTAKIPGANDSLHSRAGIAEIALNGDWSSSPFRGWVHRNFTCAVRGSVARPSLQAPRDYCPGGHTQTAVRRKPFTYTVPASVGHMTSRGPRWPLSVNPIRTISRRTMGYVILSWCLRVPPPHRLNVIAVGSVILWVSAVADKGARVNETTFPSRRGFEFIVRIG